MVLTPFLILVLAGFAAFVIVLFLYSTFLGVTKD